MNHYVYIITNLINGKKYIGKRSCRCPIEEDKYMGSGYALARAKEKYDINNFEKKILLVCNTEEEAYKEERKAIELVRAWENPMYYNISGGGYGFGSGESNVNCEKVICLNNNKIFYSVSDAANFVNIDKSRISQCCQGKAKSAGKINGKRAMWMYYDDYCNSSNEYIAKRIENSKYRKGDDNRKIICLNNKEIFNNITTASEKCHISGYDISQCCKGDKKYAGTIKSTKERLVWMYLKEYKLLSQDEIYNKIADGQKKIKKVNEKRGGHGKKSVIFLNTGEIFNSVSEVNIKYNISNSKISKSCRSFGKEPLVCGGQNIAVLFYEDYKKLNKNQIKEILHNAKMYKLKPRGKQVICLNTKEIFSSISVAAKKYRLFKRDLQKVCQENQKTAGKHPVTGESLIWMFLEDYYKKSDLEIESMLKDRKSNTKHQPKKVICLNTNEVFNSISDGGRKYKINSSGMSSCCKGRQKSAGKHPMTGEKLIWMYLDEYEEKYGKIDRQIS